MAFHDLTTTIARPAYLRSLLGNCLKFIPTPPKNIPWEEYEHRILPRLHRDVKVKAFMAKPADENNDNNSSDTPSEPYNPRMYIPTRWEPKPFMNPPDLCPRLAAFDAAIKSIVTVRNGKSNLYPHQRKALRELRQDKSVLVVQCDKNLGPALIERDKYIQMIIRDHLSDEDTYKRLHPLQAHARIAHVRSSIEQWIKDHPEAVTNSELRFLKHYLEQSKKTPFAVFYGTMKVHKTPLKSRPVVSYSGSVGWGLGVWIDNQLQSIARQQQAYFRDSAVLKSMLSTLELPANARLFTADAVSMYTNIPTDKGLHLLSAFLRRKYEKELPVDAVMSALKIIMKNNIFQFGDLFFLQRTGTAMGAPPAPPWANLFMAIAEDEFLPKHSENLLFYKRFIDDVVGIWIDDGDESKWNRFVADLNNKYFVLQWDVSERSKSVDYMDLTLTIEQGKIHTTLYEKKNNHHLYIPPKSCHPPGLLPGMVHGMIHRVFRLCSDVADRRRRITDFFWHLQRRGYEERQLRPLFHKAIEIHSRERDAADANAAQKMDDGTDICFHIQWHPHNPAPSDIQKAWRTTVAEPPNAVPLREMLNWKGTPTNIKRLIISQHRPLNLGNILSYRTLHDSDGPPASSYFD